MAHRNSTNDAGDGRGTDRSDQDAGSSNEQSSDGSSEQGSLSENLVFASVDSPRRRFILEALVEEDGAADIDRLVDDVVEIEQKAEADDDVSDPEELLEEIYDGDLPELSDIGVVDLDESSGMVALGPYADELDIDEFTPNME